MNRKNKKDKKKEDEPIISETIFLGRKELVFDPNKGMVWMDGAQLERKQKASALINQGITYQKMGNANAAIQCYTQAINLDPENLDARRNLGVLFQNLRQFDQANKLYQEILQINPRHVPTLNSISALLITLQKYAEAKEFTERALEVEPKNEHSINNKINVLRALNSFDELIPFTEDVILNNKLSTPDKLIFAYYNLGIAYKSKKQYDKAEEISRKGLDIARQTNFQQGIVFLSYELGLIFELQQKYSEALKFLEPALSLAPTHPGILQTLGDIYFELKRYKEALRCYQSVRIDHPGFMEQIRQKIIKTQQKI